MELEITGNKRLYEIDPKNIYELCNIRDLNFLTVNYLQRQALINDFKMFEDVTEAIKEIKNYILEKTDFASDLFPYIPPEQNEIPEFLIDLNKSEFMSQICNEIQCNSESENNVKKQDPSNYFYFKVLMLSISAGGYYAPNIFQIFHKNFESYNKDHLNKILLCNENDWFHYISNDICSDYSMLSATDYKLIKNITSQEYKIILLNRKKEEDIKYKYLGDFDRKKECFELIKNFSYKYGYYDAYSLTAYHDIEYYLDCFAEIIVSNNNKKNQYPISSLIYPKCFNMSDYLIFKKNIRYKRNNKFYQNELNKFTGRGKTFKDECKRFIGLLIWDVYNSKNIFTVTESILRVEKWLRQKYGLAFSQEDEILKEYSYLEAAIIEDEMRKKKFGALGIKMEDSSMEKLYGTTNACIKAGEYLYRDKNNGKYCRPKLLPKCDDFNESLQNEFRDKTMHSEHNNFKFL